MFVPRCHKGQTKDWNKHSNSDKQQKSLSTKSSQILQMANSFKTGKSDLDFRTLLALLTNKQGDIQGKDAFLKF